MHCSFFDGVAGQVEMATVAGPLLCTFQLEATQCALWTTWSDGSMTCSLDWTP